MPTLAAIIYHEDGQHELRILWQAIHQLQQQGMRVAGLINPLDSQGNKMRHLVCSLTDKREYPIMQLSGASSNTCSLNPSRLADASIIIREALNNPPDILVFNKFGSAETAGKGLIQEYAAAALAEIPVITLIRATHLAAWQAFTDSMGVILPCSVEAIIQWANTHTAQRISQH